MERSLRKALKGDRLTLEEALYLYGIPLLDLAYLAQRVRERWNPADRITFAVDRNINYTNICVCQCRFCAFHRPPGHPEGYVLDREELGRKIEELLAQGGTHVLLQGGLHPGLSLAWFEELFTWIKTRYPVGLHALSPPEIHHLAQLEGLTVKEVLKRLMEAGLDSLPGGGAEVLVDRVRQRVSPRKIPAHLWLEVMETAHRLGLKTTATMVIGLGETLEERLLHLEHLRQLQDRTGGFTAFILWTLQTQGIDLKAEKTTSLEYLRFLALSRVYLDNFPHLQASWVTQGLEVGQTALFFGADDLGSTMMEENVVKAAGAAFQATKESLIHCIRKAGFLPAQRDHLYNILSYY
ncbi:MAG TPA: dehypoxanthine futalosine cyclase [Moorella mulderi]|nr:dehypoxanthine futalosine cyclase [Moorella mulderi]